MSPSHIDDKITIWSKRIGLVILGWMLSSAYHGTLTAGRAVRAVPILQAEAGCEHYLAKKTASVAKAIASAKSFDDAAPTTQAIPADHCPNASAVLAPKK